VRVPKTMSMQVSSGMSVPIDATLTVEQAHRIAHDVEHELMHSVPRLVVATVHTEPVGARHPRASPLILAGWLMAPSARMEQR
jgi:divalent metal cation (Fe/Co/Zn/Cd) transporter